MSAKTAHLRVALILLDGMFSEMINHDYAGQASDFCPVTKCACIGHESYLLPKKSSQNLS